MQDIDYIFDRVNQSVSDRQRKAFFAQAKAEAVDVEYKLVSQIEQEEAEARENMHIAMAICAPFLLITFFGLICEVLQAIIH